MPNEGRVAPSSLRGKAALTLSRWETLPVSLRALLRFYARTGIFRRELIQLRLTVEDTVQGFIDDAFAAVEAELESTHGFEQVDFEYNTKLTLPVELTLAQVYWRAQHGTPSSSEPVRGSANTSIVEYFTLSSHPDRGQGRGDRNEAGAREEPSMVDRAESVARLTTEALLDGDMRDAINDREFDDFQFETRGEIDDIEELAEISRGILERRVEERFADFPAAVREAYEWAVDHSEGHQDEDADFRALLRRARRGDQDAIDQILDRYKHRQLETNARGVSFDSDVDIPYFATQYERVGVIYDGMIDMFRGAGIELDESFEKSVILSIIGAQIWLDDIDDFTVDMEEGQLTPVTGEYVIAETDQEAYSNVIDIAGTYLDRAIRYAMDADAILTALAAEYIYVSGSPEHLPGSNS